MNILFVTPSGQWGVKDLCSLLLEMDNDVMLIRHRSLGVQKNVSLYRLVFGKSLESGLFAWDYL